MVAWFCSLNTVLHPQSIFPTAVSVCSALSLSTSSETLSLNAVSIVVHTGYQITLFCCSLNTDQHLKELSDMGIQSVSMFAPLPTDWNPRGNDTHHSTLSTWNGGVSNRRCSIPTCWMNWYISCISICMWIFFLKSGTSCTGYLSLCCCKKMP